MKGHPHANNRHHNNNNSSSSSSNMKEAERRLGAILKTAQKLSVSPDDFSRLVAVKKLTQGTGRCRSCTRHVLPLLAGVLTLLMVLVMYSVEEQGLSCLKNTSEATVTAAKEATPTSPPGQHNQQDQAEQSEPVTSSPAERWVSSTGQLLRRER